MYLKTGSPTGEGTPVWAFLSLQLLKFPIVTNFQRSELVEKGLCFPFFPLALFWRRQRGGKSMKTINNMIFHALRLLVNIETR